MAIGVVGTAGDQGEAGPEALEQPWLLVGRAVVGHLEHIDRGEGGVCRQQGLLGRGFEVAEEEQGQPGRTDQQGDARVVRPLGHGRSGHGRGPQDLPGQRPEPAPLPRHRRDHRDPRRPGPAPHELSLTGRLFQTGRLNGADRAPAQRPGQPGHMVGVEVGEHQKRDPHDAQGTQTVVDGPRLGSGVHDDGRAGSRGQDQGVALPHIARHHPPTRRWPAGDDPGQGCRTHDGQQQQQRAHGAQQSVAQQPAAREDHGQGDGGQQQPAGPAARPVHLGAGQRRAGTGHLGDPSGGPTCRPGDPLGDGRRDGGHRERGEPEDGGGGDRHLGDEIARDGHQTDPRGHRHHDRCADRLGRGGGRQRLGQPGRYTTAPQGRAPSRREGEQRAGGQHGEQKPVAPGQPGVVEHQREDGGGQGREQGAATAGAEGEQRDQPAGRGAQHAGLGSADDDEGEREPAAEQGGGPQPDAERARETTPLGPPGQPWRTREQREHQRQVAPRDGHQMKHVRGPERLVQLGRHA
ncbi:hypothetical protein TPA0910_27930 [Streptomyces hygroscopicus subsp. sporocinereus]|uniref:Uncharacterized protein n=1 Tax=Streptomyces hygroscopicus TaxID=1912 RepID=A0ABQ3TYD9_STRHY|nr:hypothetical protein TPA0910_27930 [Streptomyces hygroscopicus]